MVYGMRSTGYITSFSSCTWGIYSYSLHILQYSDLFSSFTSTYSILFVRSFLCHIPPTCSLLTMSNSECSVLFSIFTCDLFDSSQEPTWTNPSQERVHPSPRWGWRVREHPQDLPGRLQQTSGIWHCRESACPARGRQQGWRTTKVR